MAWLAVELRMDSVTALCAGGGEVAARKAQSLLEAGAVVRVVSPKFCPAMKKLAKRYPQSCRLLAKCYDKACLKSCNLAFACTDDEKANRLIAQHAARAGIWCSVADDPESCNLHLAATMKHKEFQIGVMTGGQAPALAAAVRDELAQAFPAWLGEYSCALAKLRPWLREKCKDAVLRRAVLRQLAKPAVRNRFKSRSGRSLLLALEKKATQIIKQELNS